MLRLSRAQLREVDRISIEEYGLPGVVLMENAARSAAEMINAHHRGDGDEAAALIVCGGGNNGGDGYAIARHLHNSGWHVRILAARPLHELRGDAAIMANVAQRMTLPIVSDLAALGGSSPWLVVDALTGTGLARPLEGATADAVRAMNASGHAIVSIDVPSGLDCDTGEPLGDACIRATRTISFVAEKVGFANPRACEFTGQVTVGDIGCPRELIERVRTDRAGGSR
jgi:NAD(P)H-hydrate epimerase